MMDAPAYLNELGGVGYYSAYRLVAVAASMFAKNDSIKGTPCVY